MSMRRRPITTLIMLASFVFAIVFVFFYLREGSFEDAGARMDVVMADLGDEAEEIATDTVETTDAIIDDIADGQDEQPEE